MGVFLTNDKAEMNLTNSGWARALQTAHDHGWVPRGTALPEIPDMEYADDWDGGYATSDGQTVEEEDAKEFANALLRAVNEGERVQETLTSRQSGVGVVSVSADAAKRHSKFLSDLAAFAQQGAFSIC